MKIHKSAIVSIVIYALVTSYAFADQKSDNIYDRLADMVLTNDRLSQSINTAREEYLSFVMSQEIPDQEQAELISIFEKESEKFKTADFMVALRQKVAETYRKDFSEDEANQIFHMMNTPLFKKWKQSQQVVGLIILKEMAALK